MDTAEGWTSAEAKVSVSVTKETKTKQNAARGHVDIDVFENLKSFCISDTQKLQCNCVHGGLKVIILNRILITVC